MTTQELYTLNRRVAELQGYRFEEQIDPLSRTPVTIIWRPDGTPFVVPPDGAFWDTDKGPEFRNWAGDTDAALELATDSDLRVLVRKWDRKCVAELLWYEYTIEYSAEAEADTYAEAICRAWLAWKGE